jgi:hypothetical protein
MPSDTNYTETYGGIHENLNLGDSSKIITDLLARRSTEVSILIE